MNSVKCGLVVKMNTFQEVSMEDCFDVFDALVIMDY